MHEFFNVSAWDEDHYHEYSDGFQDLLENNLEFYSGVGDSEERYELAFSDTLEEYPYEQWMQDEFDSLSPGERDYAGSMIVGGMNGVFPAFDDSALAAMLEQFAYNCKVNSVDCGTALYEMADDCEAKVGVALPTSRLLDVVRAAFDLYGLEEIPLVLETAVSFLRHRGDLDHYTLTSISPSGNPCDLLHLLGENGHFDTLADVLDELGADSPAVSDDSRFEAYFRGVPLEDIFI